MRKTISFVLVGISSLLLVACGGGDYTGQAKTPSGSSIMEGQDFKDVEADFKNNGFTNIKLEKIEDLIAGWLTKDGEVEEVSVGGDSDYSPDKWVSIDTEVIIRYHTFPEDSTEESTTETTVETTTTEETETTEQLETTESEAEKDILNIDNCKDLASILAVKDNFDPSIKAFASKYEDSVIEFDGNVSYLSKHDGYDTRYDILVYAGDYNENSVVGPSFQFNDVGVYDLKLDTLFLEDIIHTGVNIHIVAKVMDFDENSGLFRLEPISVVVR